MKFSFSRPYEADPHKVVLYSIKYCKDEGPGFEDCKLESSDWKFTKETRSLQQIVSGLDAGTQYEFRVVARYQGDSSKVESSIHIHKTDGSKCALPNFPYSVSQVALLFSARQHRCYI